MTLPSTPARPQPPHVLINALSVGSGGGYTVARELFEGLARARPDWRFTAALIEGKRLHEEMRAAALPPNCGFIWAPAAAAGLVARARYERNAMAAWARANGVAAAVQLNGMAVRGFPAPALCHFQDPWPYRPQAWSGWADRLRALAKRRAHAAALRRGWAFGFTSGYLRDLICDFHGVRPARADVFYNGVPAAWTARAAEPSPPWSARPPELLSVSNVAPYKRQELVIRALPALARRSGLEKLLYRVVGECPPAYRAHLEGVARQLGVGDRVVIEGRVADDRLPDLYRRARAFVLMSVCESFGIPAVEAMSFGTPVVTSDCCAMPEVCGDAAELSPPDDVGALADRLATVLGDEQRAEALRAAGFQRVTRFSWDKTSAQMAAMLEEAVGT